MCSSFVVNENSYTYDLKFSPTSQITLFYTLARGHCKFWVFTEPVIHIVHGNILCSVNIQNVLFGVWLFNVCVTLFILIHSEQIRRKCLHKFVLTALSAQFFTVVCVFILIIRRPPTAKFDKQLKFSPLAVFESLLLPLSVCFTVLLQMQSLPATSDSETFYHVS